VCVCEDPPVPMLLWLMHLTVMWSHWSRFHAFFKHDFCDGRRRLFAARAITMTGKTCNQRASLMLQLMTLIPDLLCVSLVGQVRSLTSTVPAT
jgi:hypothetical protein